MCKGINVIFQREGGESKRHRKVWLAKFGYPDFSVSIHCHSDGACVCYVW